MNQSVRVATASIDSTVGATIGTRHGDASGVWSGKPCATRSAEPFEAESERHTRESDPSLEALGTQLAGSLGEVLLNVWKVQERLVQEVLELPGRRPLGATLE